MNAIRQPQNTRFFSIHLLTIIIIRYWNNYRISLLSNGNINKRFYRYRRVSDGTEGNSIIEASLVYMTFVDVWSRKLHVEVQLGLTFDSRSFNRLYLTLIDVNNHLQWALLIFKQWQTPWQIEILLKSIPIDKNDKRLQNCIINANYFRGAECTHMHFTYMYLHVYIYNMICVYAHILNSYYTYKVMTDGSHDV